MCVLKEKGDTNQVIRAGSITTVIKLSRQIVFISESTSQHLMPRDYRANTVNK